MTRAGLGRNVAAWLLLPLSLVQAQSFRDCADCPEMVVIPPGSFVMGSSVDERQREGVIEKFFERKGPQHRVSLSKPFAMGRHEITRTCGCGESFAV